MYVNDKKTGVPIDLYRNQQGWEIPDEIALGTCRLKKALTPSPQKLPVQIKR